MVSEWVRPVPDAGVLRLLSEMDEDRTYLSVVTIAELRFGIEQLRASARRSRLERWLTIDLADRFADRILGADVVVAHLWGGLLAKGRSVDRPLSAMDALLAATAQARGLTLVTRNVSDFRALGIELLNPWDA